MATTEHIGLRPIVAADHAAIVACNDAEVPRVSHLGADGLVDLLRFVDLGVLVEVDGHLAGFVLAIAPGTAYASVNYRAFEERGTDHLYVDRLVTVPAFRRRGLATRLSDAVEDHARATGRAEVTCEVNVRPPNPASLAFHRARGFREVGRQDTSGGALTVALLAEPLV
ncbi:MAG: GNAT family N-acetyltransferase [Nitriliruptoraceae bacterium]